jgi:hypothetical protein
VSRGAKVTVGRSISAILTLGSFVGQVAPPAARTLNTKRNSSPLRNMVSVCGGNGGSASFRRPTGKGIIWTCS